MKSYPQLMSLLVNTPLLAHPRTAMVIYNVICGRLGGAPLDIPFEPLPNETPGANRFVGDMPRNDAGGFPAVEPFRRKDGVGIITVTGEMVNRGAWVGANSGLTSYEGVNFQLDRAAQDARTQAILLDVESPGGQAIGAFELGEKVRQIAQVKPVYSVVNGMAASAGYAMVAGSTRIINTPSGIAGSIGVVMLHMDHSKFLENKGITPTLIHAGAHKVDANPYEALPSDVKDELQAEVNQLYDSFLTHVSQARGRRLSKKAARETEARTFIGQAAVEAGLADDVGTFDEVLAEATAKIRKQSRTTASSRRTGMSRLGIDTTDQDQADAAARQNEVNAARAAGKEEGLKEGRAEGVKTANERLNKIMSDPKVKGREAHALRIATKSPDMSAEDVIACVEDIPVASAAQPGPTTQQLQQSVAATGIDGISPQTTATNPSGNPGQEQLNAQAFDWSAHTAKVNDARKHLTKR